MSNSEITSPPRLVALDAYRGFVMFALVSNAFSLRRVAGNFEGNTFWDFLHYQLEHVAWTGCSAWDLIQPSFMFIVGVAMPYSYAARKAKGDSDSRLFAHAVYRAIILILLGVFLRSNGKSDTYWTFEDVVSQIGLGYIFVFLTLRYSIKTQGIIAASVLLGYWLLFAFWPLPGQGFDAAAAGIPDDWQQFTGFAAHWNKHTNPAGYFDAWFLQFFPNPAYTYNGGGYATLNFIPSMATMIFGVMTGAYLRGKSSTSTKCARLFAFGAAALALGMAVDGHIWPFVNFEWSIAPIVKKIWTPSFAVFSTGWTLIILAGFLYVIDVRGYKKWTFPLLVIGMNSVAMYVMHYLMDGWVAKTLYTHIGRDAFRGTFGPFYLSALVFTVLWLIAYWMYKRKIFIRI